MLEALTFGERLKLSSLKDSGFIVTLFMEEQMIPELKFFFLENQVLGAFIMK